MVGMKITYNNDEHFFPNEGVIETCYSCDLVLSDGTRFHFIERDGNLEIHLDGQMIVLPNAANAISLKRGDY